MLTNLEMSHQVNNICSEFCYEYIPAQLDERGDPQVLILNTPSEFESELETRLLPFGFFCARLVPNGGSSIMQFKKVARTAGKDS